MKVTKTIKHKYEDWDKILDLLVNAGVSFYEMYGDIEDAYFYHDRETDSEFEVTLTGSDDAWEEYYAVEREVCNGEN